MRIGCWRNEMINMERKQRGRTMTRNKRVETDEKCSMACERRQVRHGPWATAASSPLDEMLQSGALVIKRKRSSLRRTTSETSGGAAPHFLLHWLG